MDKVDTFKLPVDLILCTGKSVKCLNETHIAAVSGNYISWCQK